MISKTNYFVTMGYNTTKIKFFEPIRFSFFAKAGIILNVLTKMSLLFS